MKIYSFMAIKGGVGKTTLAYQFSQYLARQNKKVLMIDLDSQKSLTSTFENSDFIFDGKVTIADLLLDKNSDAKPYHVQDNIDVYPGLSTLDGIVRVLEENTMAEMRLFMWFVAHFQDLKEEYDFVIIDLPPAWNVLSKNGVTVSDVIISPMEPSRFGVESHGKVLSAVEDLKTNVVDPMTGETYVTAKVQFVSNRIKHNTATSRDFLEASESLDDVIAVVPEKEAINSAMLHKKGVFEYLDSENKLSREAEFIALFDSVMTKFVEAGE